MFTPLTINVTEWSLAAAQQALAFFEMGQVDPVTIEIDDDSIKVHLDLEYLTFPFDDSQHNDRDVYVYVYGESKNVLVTAYEYLQEKGLSEDDALELSDAIDEQMAELGGFAYDAAAAAINTLRVP